VDEFLGWALKIIDRTGTVGAVIASAIVGLVLAIIVYAKSTGLLSFTRTETQKGDFQDRLITQVDKLMLREAALQAEADRIESENDRLKDEMRDLRTQIVLMRNQLRRAIDLLRAVREGRLPPEAIAAADTIEVTP
jgi:hypothetical protein